MNPSRWLSVGLLALCVLRGSGQVTVGTPPMGTFTSDFDKVDLANLNNHFEIPVFSRAGRGTPFSYAIAYDSSIWYPVQSGSTKVWANVSDWGWHANTDAEAGYLSYIQSFDTCNYRFSNWV